MVSWMCPHQGNSAFSSAAHVCLYSSVPRSFIPKILYQDSPFCRVNLTPALLLHLLDSLNHTSIEFYVLILSSLIIVP